MQLYHGVGGGELFQGPENDLLLAVQSGFEIYLERILLIGFSPLAHLNFETCETFLIE